MNGRRDIKEFYESQKSKWPLALQNISSLNSAQIKTFKSGSLAGMIMYNPARAVSTLAKVDSNSIKKRACFLCKGNRPEEQESIEIIPGFDLLVNPFPILPMHFTISCSRHIDQKYDYNTACRLAQELPGMVVFFNDNGAGASAPDHLHYQAVEISSLPLLKLIDDKEKIKQLPFKVIDNIEELTAYKGIACNYYNLVNERGEQAFIAIPRKAHRPDLFYKDPPSRRAISPGGIDMAGVIVTPFLEDFEAVTDNDITEIYRQVAFPNE